MGIISLWVLAMPVTATFLALSLESDPALHPDLLATLKADAIVILTGGQNETAPEFGEPVSHRGALTRIRYGAFLHRRTGLPVLLSGGSVHGDEQRSLAQTMAFDLSNGFGIKPRWMEEKSRTTAENARYTYTMLAEENKTSIVLVTNALHMMRARWSFEQVGFKVQGAPTDFIDRRPFTLQSFLPNSNSLNISSQVIHEWLGFWVYRLLTQGE